MSHKFLPSSKKNVYYCYNCGCLSYENIPSKNTPSDNRNILKIDPLSIKYQPISLNLDLTLSSHQNYINLREKGLSKIYFLSNNFNIEKTIIYKAIGLMDLIFLNNNDIAFENLEIVASICMILSFEFNYNIIYTKNKKLNSVCNSNSLYVNKAVNYVNNFTVMYQCLKKKITNIIYWQIFCLKKLNYNLGKYSALDYLNLFFGLGIIFAKKDVDIVGLKEFCVSIFEIIVNKYNICKYNQYVIALSIINIAFKNNFYFNEKIFKNIYWVDYSKKKYQICINEINLLINNIWDLKILNSLIINNINNLYNNLFIKFINNAINNNYKYNNKNNECNKDSSLIKKLFLKFIYFFEKLKLNNYSNISNIEILNLYYTYFSKESLNYDLIEIDNYLDMDINNNKEK